MQRKPFDYLVVPGFIRPDALAVLNRDYPQIQGPGNMSADDLDCGPAFAELLATLKSQPFAELVGEKFDVDLGGCSATISVRRYSEATDGNIHTDHRSKLITLLLYFNTGWEHEGGRLRMLNSASDIEDYAARGDALLRDAARVPAHGHFLSWSQAVRRRAADAAAELDPRRRRRRYVSSLTKPVRRLLNLS